MSKATLNKHLQELVKSRFLIRRENFESKEWPRPVLYALAEDHIIDLNLKYGNAIGKLIAFADEIKDQTEFIDCLTEYFQDGLKILLDYHSNHKNDERGVKGTLFMLGIFLRYLEPTIQSFILRQ